MPQASNYYSILSSVATAIQGLGLTDWNGKAVPVVVQKIFSRRRKVDVTPSMFVSRAQRPERVQPLVFGDTVWVWYPVLISTVAAGNYDLVSQLDFYLSWRQQLRRAFQSATLSGVSAVWDTNMLPDSLLDEATINKSYDIELLTVEFRTSEQRLTT